MDMIRRSLFAIKLQARGYALSEASSDLEQPKSKKSNVKGDIFSICSFLKYFASSRAIARLGERSNQQNTGRASIACSYASPAPGVSASLREYYCHDMKDKLLWS